MTLKPFEEVVAEYGPTVLRVCRAVLGPVEAEDAWSETFLAALRAYPDLRPGSNVEAWLVTIAHRHDPRQQRGRGEESRRGRDQGTARHLPEGSIPMSTMNKRSPGTGGVLDALPVVDEDANRRLHRRLVDAADAAGILDVAYRTLDTPVGSLLLAATGQGLVRVAYAREGHDQVLAKLAERVSPRILLAPRRLDTAALQIEEYFAGRRNAFDVALDWRLSHGFRREVLMHLLEIGYGKTASYAAVAAAAGSPRAVRAAGTACATNPLPVVVPCHRVVRSDGTIGGYAGGPEAKQTLLALEAAA